MLSCEKFPKFGFDPGDLVVSLDGLDHNTVLDLHHVDK